MKKETNYRLWIVLGVLVVAAIGGLIWYKNRTVLDSGEIRVKDKSNTESVVKTEDYVNKLDINKAITKDDVANAIKKVTGKEISDSEKAKIIPDHTLGKADSKVTVIEYEDFACVHCQQVHSYTEKIQDEYKDRVHFIYRDYSLGYPNSQVTITAGEAAYKVGGDDAFWKMYKLLFQNDMWVSQAVVTDKRKSTLNDYAKQSGIDVDKFNKTILDAENNGIQHKIDRDKAIGIKAGVSGTPTWIVNGKKLESVTYDDMKKAIDEALKDAE